MATSPAQLEQPDVTEPVGRWSSRLRADADSRALPFIAFVLSAAISFAVYWRVLTFSYFLDDAFDLTRTEQTSFWALLSRPLPGYSYYRPIPFMIWKAIYLLTGGYDATILHLIPLLSHALSGWLLFMLLWRLTRSSWSLLPMILFLLYPFSYQDLEILGTLVHTLVTVEILAVLLLWYDGRLLNAPVRMTCAALLSGVALWTHEYGVVILPLLVGFEALLWWRRRVARPTVWLLPVAAFEGLYLWLWFTMDKPGADHRTTSDAIHNVGIWLEGFAYPVTRQTGWLTNIVGGDPLRMILPIGVVGVIGVAAIYLVRRCVWTPLLTIAVGGMVFVPAIIGLTYEYVQNSPRLLYVVAPASAIFWGMLPSLRFERRWLTWIWRGALLALVSVVLLQSLLFIQRRMTMLEYGTQIADGIIREGEAHPNGNLLFINVPSWFSPKTQEFPRGHLGIQIEPDYINLSTLIYAGSGLHVRAESFSLAPDVSGWRYDFQPHGQPIDHDAIDQRLRSGETLVVVDLYHDALAVREPGSLTPNQTEPRNEQATFGDGLALLGATITRDGDLVTIDSHWYVRSALDGDYQLWTQLRDADGNVMAERKDYALRGMSPPRLWQPGDLIDDRLVLDLSQAANSGPLSARVSLVSTADGSLLPVSGRGVVGGWLELGRVPRQKK
ncbi:MAG: hypothetical protein WBW04_02750 [Nitrolancea sp.]